MTDRIHVVGEALIDVVHHPEGHSTEAPGGSPARVAMGLARMGHEVELTCSFADDPRGRMLRDHLVSSPRLHLTPGCENGARTSLAVESVFPNGDARHSFSLEWDVARILRHHSGHLHTGSLACVVEPGADAVVDVMRRASERGTVSYHPNARPSIMGDSPSVMRRVEQCVALSDVVRASETDIEQLYPGRSVVQVAARWASLGPALVAVTRGNRGVTVHLPGASQAMTLPGMKVSVRDTCGAGDAFTVGLLSGLTDLGLLGSSEAGMRLYRSTMADVLPAVERAVTASAWTVGQVGPQMPSRVQAGIATVMVEERRAHA